MGIITSTLSARPNKPGLLSCDIAHLQVAKYHWFVNDKTTWDKEETQLGDLNPFLERIIALRQSIVDDGIAQGVPFHEKDLQLVVERLRNEGSSFVKVTLPILGKALDLGLVVGQFHCPANFSRKRDTCLPTFMGAVFGRIFGTDGNLLVSPEPCSIYFLRQFLLFDGKLITEPTVIQKKEAIDGFRERQRILGKTKVPQYHPVLERAKLLLSRTLKGLDLSTISPGHGPGGVAEGMDRIVRWDFNSWPSRAERWYPFHVYGSQSFRALCISGPPRMIAKSYTKCSLVPKDFKGPRLISAESAATQYLQQGQMKSLMRYIQRHPLLSRSIKLSDQTFSQKLCKKAFDAGMGTLDLSNASDTVSAALVWYLLSGVPRLRSQLFCTRSQYLLFGSEEPVRITAFSPMGSAVCFPVETLVFWAITMASVRHVQASWRTSLSREGKGSLPLESETASEIAVFGDDIIAPTYAFSTIIGTLETIGCQVNRSKTCYMTPFRESCGSEWYNSIDITITRNRRYYYDVTRKFVNYPVILDLQRKFFLQGLERTAALLLQWAREISPVATIELGEHGSNIYRSLDGCPKGHPHQGSMRYWLYTLRIRRTDEAVFGCDGRLTAFPSGLDCFVRGSTAFDRTCCAFGWYTSLDRGVPTRYNKEYQRTECRLPGLFQRTSQWDTYTIDPRKDERIRLPRGRNLTFRSQGCLEYARLLARVVGDSVERIAIRDVMSKMAWSDLPYKSALADLNG